MMSPGRERTLSYLRAGARGRASPRRPTLLMEDVEGHGRRFRRRPSEGRDVRHDRRRALEREPTDAGGGSGDRIRSAEDEGHGGATTAMERDRVPRGTGRYRSRRLESGAAAYVQLLGVLSPRSAREKVSKRAQRAPSRVGWQPATGNRQRQLGGPL